MFFTINHNDNIVANGLFSRIPRSKPLCTNQHAEPFIGAYESCLSCVLCIVVVLSAKFHEQVPGKFLGIVGQVPRDSKGCGQGLLDFHVPTK